MADRRSNGARFAWAGMPANSIPTDHTSEVCDTLAGLLPRQPPILLDA